MSLFAGENMGQWHVTMPVKIWRDDVSFCRYNYGKMTCPSMQVKLCVHDMPLYAGVNMEKWPATVCGYTYENVMPLYAGENMGQWHASICRWKYGKMTCHYMRVELWEAALSLYAGENMGKWRHYMQGNIWEHAMSLYAGEHVEQRHVTVCWWRCG